MNQKTVLITGGSRGIGAATVRLFARRGYQVAFTYKKSQAAAQSLVNQLAQEGYEVLAVQSDGSDGPAIAALVAEIMQHFGQLDILICNAGAAWSGLLTDMDDGTWAALRGINLDGPLALCRGVYPHMVGQKWGRILTVSSIWGRAGASCEVGYCATKAGLIGMTQALAKELGPSGITVNAVAPGVIDTEMNHNLTPSDLETLAQETPLGRLGRPEEVAHALLFLASEEAGFITGQTLGVDGGFL